MKRFVPFLFLLYFSPLQSQSFEFGVYGGVSLYEGDLAPNSWELYFNTLRPAYGVLVRSNMAPWLSLRAGYTHMTIMGDDAISSRSRGLNFRTDINEVAFNVEINLFRLHLFGGSFYVEPYGYLGVGVFHYKPQTFYQDQWIDLQPLGTEGQGLQGYKDKYKLWVWTIPAGGGVKLHLNEHWILGFEGSGRWTLSDYLDDVSGARLIYQDILEGNGPLAATLSRPNFDPTKNNPTKPYYRGGTANDYVFTFGATLTYLFGPDLNDQGRNAKVKCPEF